MLQTRILLSLWDPGLVEEALNFVEEYKIAVTNDDSGVSEDFTSLENSLRPSLPLSPFKRITQQLTTLDLKSPDLDDFATPSTPRTVEDIWKLPDGSTKLQSLQVPKHHDDNKTIQTISADVWNLKMQKHNAQISTPATPADAKVDDNQFIVYPEVDNELESRISENLDDSGSSLDNNNKTDGLDNGKIFLDTKVMLSSPSANYYKPTDEPEPWDLTQLNIEASVMCLVSKVKFLCGRCGSPAVRLRGQKSVNRGRSFRKQALNNQVQSKDEGVTTVNVSYMI